MFILNSEISNWYKNTSQKIRIMTELRTWENIFCPNCWGNIYNYSNNKLVADFYCNACIEDYELKSWIIIGSKIVDWAYSTMIERLNSNNNPNFFFLNYNNNYEIQNFMVIPKHYFTTELIEKRKPLSITAKRAWWIWCNILLSWIPNSWKIFYIKNWENRKKGEVLSDWHKTIFLNDKSIKSKNRIIDIMQSIELLNNKIFTLSDIYKFKQRLYAKYPNNNNIEAKIRQQLQFLRNKWYLEFLGNGSYKIV